MVLMVLVYVMLVYLVLADAHIETQAQAEAVPDALLCHRLPAGLGLGCLLICCHRFAITAAGGHREHAEQTQLKRSKCVS